MRVDLTGPTLTGVTPARTPIHGSPRTATVSASRWRSVGPMSERGSVAAYVRDDGGTSIRSFSVPATTTAAALSWDGKANDGSVVPDGTYDVRLIPRDGVGNAGPSVMRSVTGRGVPRLGHVVEDRVLSTGPRRALDRDAALLRAPAAGGRHLDVRNASGAVVATLLDGVDTPAGTTAVSWYALNDAGAMLPTGRYTSVVSATDGALTAVQSVGFEMAAFGIRPSASTATRGRSITISVTIRGSALDRAAGARRPARCRDLGRDPHPHVGRHVHRGADDAARAAQPAPPG